MLTKKLTVILALSAFVSACSTAPGNYLSTSRLEDNTPTPDVTYPVHLIDAQLVMKQAQEAEAVAQTQALPPIGDLANYSYRIAPADIIGVTVYDHPEISTPAGTTFSAGGNTTQTVGQALTQPYATALPGQSDPFGLTVSTDGTIYFPFIGRILAAGKTPEQLRAEIAAGLVNYIHDPQVNVRVLAFRGQRVQVTGDVTTPGPLAISDVPLTLVDAITRSGGTTANADYERVRLTRDNKLYVLNADRLLDHGDMSQDVLLQNGDIINIPDRSDSRVFVIGEVKTPIEENMIRGRLTIADALTQAGGILDTDANPRQIFVMRDVQNDPSKPEIYRLDMTQPDAIMLSSQFQLRPMDVVYVGTASSTTFNRMLQEVLPTIETIFYTKQITQ
ncbi:exopolysaccharide biosynthesis protein [Burkholderia sp. WAC0059]|uniref:polysaccharide biosynthesis/export family protein n=1 Tax=Burkholderia sp. WAC0059 TaxID=2066022 RepID=UPI000C7F4FB3|nr:polysaccharide biosynthesis/export family protein [Burkholderia sp. WAC0059]PLZ04480.1 exopolysaccharide biosynthesis protein [Burkholderia sp. WAC0059]